MSETTFETEEQAVEAIVETGVVLSDGTLAHTEGEGRQRRYYLGDENVAKGDVVEAVLSDEDAEPAAEGDDGDIVCEYCGDALGYLTGSHMQSHDSGPQTVDQYREFVAEQKGLDTSDVQLCTDEMMETFEQAGDHDEGTIQELREQNEARWEAGEYDHLRKEDESEDEAES